jgi:hypothetical protein
LGGVLVRGGGWEYDLEAAFSLIIEHPE